MPAYIGKAQRYQRYKGAYPTPFRGYLLCYNAAAMSIPAPKNKHLLKPIYTLSFGSFLALADSKYLENSVDRPHGT